VVAVVLTKRTIELCFSWRLFDYYFLGTFQGAVATRLKGGKKGEKEEFENLLKEAEAELLQSNSKRGGAAVEIPVAVAATPVESEVPVEALSVSEPAAAVEEAPSA